MAGRGSRTGYVALAIAIASFILVVPVQMKIDSVRAKLIEDSVLPTQLPNSAAASAALGGFRGLAVDVLWMKADALQNDRQFYQLKTIYELISVLQPNFPTVWAFNTWNLAYNISAEWGQPEDKWIWVQEGLKYGNEGLKYNPDSTELWIYVGMVYMHKIGKDTYLTRRQLETNGVEPYEKAAEYFQKALEISRKQGEMDVLLSRLHAQAVYHHAMAVFKSTGNVPETVRLFDMAHEEVTNAQMDFPADAALEKLRNDIEANKTLLLSWSTPKK